jgi:hypothetical protein
MSTPHYTMEMACGAAKTFRVAAKLGSVTGAAIDLTDWGSLSFMAKRRYTDDDDDAIIHKVLFDGVEVIDAEEGLMEIGILAEDTDDLTEGIRYTLIADVTGVDADLKPHQLLTITLLLYPRVKRANV